MTEPTDHETLESETLQRLTAQFMQALRLKDNGDIDRAEDALRDILRTEPRLPEPHMELARILLDTARLEEAESHAREALGQLKANGQWNEDIPEQVMLALCHGLLAEILRRIADEDDVLFGDPERFRALLTESQTHFETAAGLDPSDEYSSYHAFFLGVQSENGAKES